MDVFTKFPDPIDMPVPFALLLIAFGLALVLFGLYLFYAWLPVVYGLFGFEINRLLAANGHGSLAAWS